MKHFLLPLIVAPLLVLQACAPKAAANGQPSEIGSTAQGTARAGDPLPLALDAGTRVEVAVLRPSEARLQLRLPGEVEGAREALLAAPLGGYVEAVRVSEGERVRKGALLAKVDSSIYAVQLEQAEADLELAQADLARTEQLGDLSSEANNQALATRVRIAEAGVRAARIRLSRTRIVAPFSGVIANLGLEVGEVVGPGSPAMRLVKLDPAVINLSVSDRDVTSLKVGMEVSVLADATLEPRKGRLARISPAGNLKTRTFVAEVEVANPDRTLLPGMIASSTVSEIVANEAIVIPQDWLVTRLDGLGLYVAVDGAAVWRPVVVGAVVGDQAVLSSGVSPGEKVVIKGHRDLAAGDALVVARSGKCCTLGRATF